MTPVLLAVLFVIAAQASGYVQYAEGSSTNIGKNPQGLLARAEDAPFGRDADGCARTQKKDHHGMAGKAYLKDCAYDCMFPDGRKERRNEGEGTPCMVLPKKGRGESSVRPFVGECLSGWCGTKDP